MSAVPMNVLPGNAARWGGFNPGPWVPGAVVAIVLIDALTLGVLGVSAYRAAGQSATSDQMPWLNLASAAVVVLAAANVGWLASGRRTVAAQGRFVRSELSHTLNVLTMTAVPAVEGLAGVHAQLVAAPAMRWYHRSKCRLAAGKSVTAASAASHQAAGRRPCGVCAP